VDVKYNLRFSTEIAVISETVINNNNNNKQAFQNAQLTDNCHKGARSNYTGTVWNKAVFSILYNIDLWLLWDVNKKS